MSQAIIITAIICGTIFAVFFLIIEAALIVHKRKIIQEIMEKDDRAAGFEKNFKPGQTEEIINKSLNDILDEYEKKE